MEKPPPRSAVVVNENTAQLRLAALILEKEGLSVTGFGSAEEALGHMDPDAPPNVIITDLHMPGLDGWRLCRLLRSPEYPTFNQTPILVLSATFSGDDVSEITTQLGANAFLSIPYQPDQLRSHVRDLLAGRTPQAKKRVLIVEDSHTLANLLEKSFVDYGYDVQTAYTGEEARKAFSTYAPDIVILDYFLPDTTGDTLLPLFKKPGSRTVVIIETVDVDPERALRLLHSGADAYVRKPFEPAFLIDQCENALRARSLMRSEELLETRTAELRRSEERFRSYFELPLVGSAVLSTDMNWIEVNSWLCRYLGYARGELKRLSWTEVTHPDDRDAEREQIDRLLSDKAEAYSMEQRFVRKDDGVVFANVSVGLVRSEDGTPEFFVALVQDISERKRAEEKLRLLSSAVEQSTEGLAITDLEGNITYANKTIAQLHGYASDEVIGKHVSILHLPEQMPLVEAVMRRTLETGEFSGEIGQARRDGSVFPGLVQSSLLRDESGEPVGLIQALRDMTGIKRSEMALQKAHQALAAKAAELEAANEELSEYAHVVAHDLKAPLRAIHNYADLLRDDLAPSLEGSQKDCLEGLCRAARQGNELVDDLLELTRIDGSSAQIERIEMGDFIRSLIDSMDIPSDAEIVVQESWPVLDAEETLLRQIFQNLIDNAVKFNTSKRKRIEVGWVTSEERDVYEFFVKDNGIGIDPMYQEQIFRVFERLHSLEEYQGTGIGLAIVKKAAATLEGTARVESELGKGSTFWVAFPRSRWEL